MEPKSFTKEAIAVNTIIVMLCGVVPRQEQTFSLLENALATISYVSLTVYLISYTLDFIMHVNLASFAMVLSILGGQIRYTVLLYHRVRLVRMLKDCERLWLDLTFEEKSCVKGYTIKTNRLTYYYLFGCAFTIFFYNLAFIISGNGTDNGSTNDTRKERSLPYAFFEIQETPYFEIAYVVQLIMMSWVGLTCVATDTICPALILVAAGHLKVIQTRLGIKQKENDESKEKEAFLKETKVGIRSAVRYHRTILGFCEDIEKMGNLIFLTQLAASTYNISLIGFKLVGEDADKYKFTTQLAIAVIQLFLCNWPPDILLVESEAVASAMYFMSWYRYSNWLRQCAHVIIMRSQKPIKMTAGKFTTLSLETFASMVSAAASFFTVLSSMN